MDTTSKEFLGSDSYPELIQAFVETLESSLQEASIAFLSKLKVPEHKKEDVTNAYKKALQSRVVARRLSKESGNLIKIEYFNLEPIRQALLTD